MTIKIKNKTANFGILIFIDSIYRLNKLFNKALAFYQ